MELHIWGPPPWTPGSTGWGTPLSVPQGPPLPHRTGNACPWWGGFTRNSMTRTPGLGGPGWAPAWTPRPRPPCGQLWKPRTLGLAGMPGSFLGTVSPLRTLFHANPPGHAENSACNSTEWFCYRLLLGTPTLTLLEFPDHRHQASPRRHHRPRHCVTLATSCLSKLRAEQGSAQALPSRMTASVSDPGPTRRAPPPCG